MLRVIVFINNPISMATAATAIKNNYIEGKAAPQEYALQSMDKAIDVN